MANTIKNPRKVKSLDVQTLVIYHTAIAAILKYDKSESTKEKYSANNTSEIFMNIDNVAFVDLTLTIYADLRKVYDSLLDLYKLEVTTQELRMSKFSTKYVQNIKGLTEDGTVLACRATDDMIANTLNFILVVEQYV